ncbi:hypothetical protein D9756_009124 [Leucocoprinus leucothites]|uniref:BTB domain-containing protein n=1 Tax=Leucocoprinus leucothites TaxID=201217 RepID=A0A8H5FUD9_9AGAR|nr:hypothetical protein D9756_009124 [Leucoagaricus leucothites]
MDPSRNTIPPYYDYPSNVEQSAQLPLGSPNLYLTYPSPISPPRDFLGHQFQAQSPPMTSHAPSPQESEATEEDDTTTVISLSTVFHPGAHTVEPDTTFITSDMVLFYVHSQVLRGTSPHAFRRVFEAHRDLDKNTPTREAPSNPSRSDELIHVPDTSAVLNVILHMLYGTSSAQHSPSFEILTTAVNQMPYYDLVPKNHIVPRTPLYDLLLTHAPLFPLQLYTLAAHHDLQELAVATSSHLLSYPLSNLPEEAVDRMGALYLKRLLCLHLDRFNALKQILLSPPHPHPATRQCSFQDQKKLTRAWALVSAYLAWDARPGMWSLSG